MSHQSLLIRDIATYGVQFARVISPLGRNIIFCMRRYRFSFYDFIFERIDMQDVKMYLSRSVPGRNIATANFLKELLSIRDRTSFVTADSSFLTQSELSDICLLRRCILVILFFFVIFISFFSVFYHMLRTITRFVNCITIPLCTMNK